MSLGRNIKKGQVVRASDLPSIYNADFLGQVNIPADFFNVGNGQLIATGGKIGVGTTNPTEKLEVVGNISSQNLILGQGAAEGNISKLDSLFGVTDIRFGMGTTLYHTMTSTGLSLGKTTNPTEKIDVVGNGNFTGSLMLGSSSRTLNDAQTGAIFLDTKGSGIVGRFGTGGAGDYYRRLLTVGSASNAIEIGQAGTGLINGVDIWTGTGTNHFRIMTSDVERFRILADGKVGIGTATPNDTLQVTGDFSLTSSSNTERHLFGTRSSNQLYLQSHADFRILRGYLNTTGNRKMDALDTAFQITGTDIGMALDKGNVGIGTLTPGAKLEVVSGSTIAYPTPGLSKGSLHLQTNSADGSSSSITFGGTSGTNSAQAGIYVQSSGNYGTKMYFGTTSAFVTGSVSRMMIDSGGNVGIGNVAPTAKLDVTGTIASTAIYAKTGESQFSLGVYADVHVGTSYAIKASGGIATNLIYNSGNMTVNGNTTMIGTLGVSGATSLSSLTVSPVVNKSHAVGGIAAYGLSEINIHNTIGDNQSHLSLHKGGTMAWQFGIAGNDLVIGNTQGAGRADVERTSMFHLTATTGFLGLGTADPTSNLHVVGTSNITGNTTIGGTLGVTGSATVGGTLVITGAFTVNNTLRATGAATLTSTLAVSGATTLSTTLAVTGNTTMTTLTASGAVNMSSTLSVTDIVAMKTGSKIRGDGTGAANTAWMGFYESNGSTRVGYVGVLSNTSDTTSVFADRGDASIIAGTSSSVVAKSVGGVDINAGTGIVTINVNGNTTNGSLRLFDNRAAGVSNEFMTFENSGGRSGWVGFYQSSNMTIQNMKNASLNFGTNNATRMTIAAAGQVGINSTSPLPHSKLDVRGSVVGGAAATTVAPTVTGVTVETAFEARSTAAGADPGIAFHKETAYTSYLEGYKNGTEQGITVATPTTEGKATMKADRFSASGKFSIEYNSVEDSLDFIYN